mmetsp:Transcript_21133/g.29051  ORF Transcript_21133/g.29051 Transcript_21133/m.29051 type:complete len:599 (+) Transcript_21133:398-2194(+)
MTTHIIRVQEREKLHTTHPCLPIQSECGRKEEEGHRHGTVGGRAPAPSLHHHGVEVRHAGGRAVQPGELLGAHGLEPGNQVRPLQGLPDVVQAVHQLVLARGVQLERDLLAVGADDDLVGQVHLQLEPGLGIRQQGGHQRPLQHDGQHAVLEAVVVEDVREGGGNDGLDALVLDRPGRVLAAGAAAEVVARHQHLRLGPGLLVQDEVALVDGHLGAQLGHVVRVLVPQLRKGGEAQAGALDRLQVLLGDDHVRVDVLDVQRGGHALDRGEGQPAGVLRVRAAGALGVDLRAPGGPRGRLLQGERRGRRLPGCAQRRQLAHVRQLARDGRGGRHGRGHQVRAAAVALPALKVAVAGGGAALLRLELVRVHGQAHGAAGLTPVEARGQQHLVQPLGLRLLLDQPGARHHHRVHAGRHPPPLCHLDHLADVLDAAVGAAADEHFLHRHLGQHLAGLQAHVLQGAAHARRALGAGRGLRVWHDARDGRCVLRGGAPGDGRRDVRRLDLDHRVVGGAGVAAQGVPVLEGRLPLLAVGGRAHGPVAQVLVGGLVGGDEPGAGAGLDGHVGDGHAGLHAEAADGGAGELDGAPSAASSANHPAHV